MIIYEIRAFLLYTSSDEEYSAIVFFFFLLVKVYMTILLTLCVRCPCSDHGPPLRGGREPRRPARGSAERALGSSACSQRLPLSS